MTEEEEEKHFFARERERERGTSNNKCSFEVTLREEKVLFRPAFTYILLTTLSIAKHGSQSAVIRAQPNNKWLSIIPVRI